ncbi:MAG: AarF/ABC1/UbiB kinase family protein [Chloroflexi bacterium]|nr:AarF/ABC1/UbiB kinase family protein [Chloroflexota bacterium]
MIERRPSRSLFGRLVGGPAGFRRRLERLGPTWIKIGQYLALQPDLISREYADELMRLFDRVEPAPWAVVRQVIREDLGADPEDLFAAIDPEPIGSGAVAQTYRAQLRDGTEVAVKVQRPGVRAQVERDLGRIRMLIGVLASAGILRAVSPRDLAEELRGWMLAEVDFRNSLANVTVLHREAADSPIERIPEPFPAFCGPRVETTELVRGVPLSAVLDVQRGGTGGIWAEAVARIDREAVAENLLTATLRQIFRYRFFHADVHPGNLFVFEDSSIGYVDFGLCVAWDGTMRERLLRYLDAVYRSDVEQMYRAASEILVPSEDTDMTAFRTEFFSESWRWMSRLRASNEMRAGASAVNEPSPIAQWMIAVMQAARRNGLRVPSVVVSIYRALLVAESVAHQLEASADLRSVGRRFFERLRTEELYRSLDPSNLQQIALSGVQLQRDGPGQMRQLLANMVDGSFTVTVHTFEAPRVRRAWNRRLKMVVAAALSLGVAVILTRPDLPPELTTLLVVMLAALYLTIAVLWARLR